MEFDLIHKYFHRPSKNPQVLLGNGDDCALIQTNQTLAFSIDTLVYGTHFTDSISPFDLGYRALAVNLSDLAAMGAKPVAFLLALTLPNPDDVWLSEFSRGLFSLADSFSMDLIGGNTTQGPLAITIQIIGTLPQGKALKRSNAKTGDDMYVTGILGLGLVKPTPRILFAQALLDLAHAAIDISDGLTQDLSHILAASKLGAVIDLHKIPGSHFDQGEDYELCFTAPKATATAIETLATTMNVPLSKIGHIIEKPGLWQIENGQYVKLPIKGYQHFRESAI